MGRLIFDRRMDISSVLSKGGEEEVEQMQVDVVEGTSLISLSRCLFSTI